MTADYSASDRPAAWIEWSEEDVPRRARWRSEAGSAPPRRTVLADDTMTADRAYRLACEGNALLWRGDFQNARQLLQAMARRIEQKPPKRAGGRVAKGAANAAPKPALKSAPIAILKTDDKAAAGSTTDTAAESALDIFNRHRLAQSQRARTLGALLIPLHGDYTIPLRRAPNVVEACRETYGPESADAEQSYLSLRELLGVIGAHEWRKKGVPVAEAGGHIHPYYGVFSPVRGEYIRLIAQAPLPATDLAFDIGTGTGVLAAVLARRGVAKIIATDMDLRALACARDNVSRLGLSAQVDIVAADLFPPGRAALIVCNPPWLPARPSSPIENAIYDPDSRMLRGFLAGLAAHLLPGGEGWLIMSDFAEHLGLRSPDQLAQWIAAAGLRVAGRTHTKPVHPRSTDAADPLHRARAAETTSLWRLTV